MKRRRALLVNDEEALLEIVADRLVSYGYSVEAVRDGEACLRRLREDPPDVVLLDLLMPGIGGLDVLDQMSREGLTVPVVILSASADSQQIDDGMAAGARACVPKPFDPAHLRQTLEAVLEEPSR